MSKTKPALDLFHTSNLLALKFFYYSNNESISFFILSLRF